MTIENKAPLKFDHDAYAKTRAKDDFWGQVRRTVQGVPVSDEQITMILDAIRLGLGLEQDDTLLDIACGNGALAQRLFPSCSGYLGVDLSEHLISVAKANFESLPEREFMHRGAAEYVRGEERPDRFSKALCYGSFQYFPAPDAAEVLETLFQKFSRIKSVFVGNLPDKDRAAEFYKREPNPDELAESGTAIGIWRTTSEFKDLAETAGWKTSFSRMPSGFYSSHYRYDALLTR